MSTRRSFALRQDSVEAKNPRKYFRKIFNKYDKDNDGHISVKELEDLIESQDYEHDLPEHVVSKIHNLADTDGDGRLNFNEFVNMINHPALRPLFGSLLNSYVHILIPSKTQWYPTRGLFEDQKKYWPPPIALLLISVVEIVLYYLDSKNISEDTDLGPIATALIYNPKKRYEIWRYITYMCVHIGVIHLIVNLCIQILLGTPLEMVHRWWRVLVIYFAGILAGSLGTSITDPTVKLAGASGGVYALVTAQISTIAMNWKEMEYPGVQLLIYLIITFCDVGVAIRNRHILKINDNTGYAAHFAGALAGLLVGINVVRNIHVTNTERVVWWISIVTYVTLMGVAIVWNVAYTDYFPQQE